MSFDLLNKTSENFSNSLALSSLKTYVQDLKAAASDKLEQINESFDLINNLEELIIDDSITVTATLSEWARFKSLVNSLFKVGFDMNSNQPVSLRVTDNDELVCKTITTQGSELEIAVFTFVDGVISHIEGTHFTDITGTSTTLSDIIQGISNQLTEMSILSDVIKLIESGQFNMFSYISTCADYVKGSSDEVLDFFDRMKEVAATFAVTGDVSSLLNLIRNMTLPASAIQQDSTTGEITTPGYEYVYSFTKWVWIKTGLNTIFDIASAVGLACGKFAISAIATLGKGIISVADKIINYVNDGATATVQTGGSPFFSPCLFSVYEQTETFADKNGPTILMGGINGFISTYLHNDDTVLSRFDAYASPLLKNLFNSGKYFYDHFINDSNTAYYSESSVYYFNSSNVNFYMGTAVNQNTKSGDLLVTLANTYNQGLYTAEEANSLSDNELLARCWLSVILSYWFAILGYSIEGEYIPSNSFIWGIPAITPQSEVRNDLHLSVLLEYTTRLLHGVSSLTNVDDVKNKIISNLSRLSWETLINYFIPCMRPFVESLLSLGFNSSTAGNIEYRIGSSIGSAVTSSIAFDQAGLHNKLTNSFRVMEEYEDHTYVVTNYEYANPSLSNFCILPPHYTESSVLLAKIIAAAITIVAVVATISYATMKITNTKRQLNLAANTNSALETFKSDPTKENYRNWKRANRKLSRNTRLFGECRYASAFSQASYGWSSDSNTSYIDKGFQDIYENIIASQYGYVDDDENADGIKRILRRIG